MIVLMMARARSVSAPFARLAPSPAESPAQLPGLKSILDGSWKDVDLAPFNKLAEALDLAHGGVKNTVEGHSAQITDERKVYVAIARLPHVSHICEIGFNGGHSASLWMLANPTAKVTMFDIWLHKYANKGEAFLRSADAAEAGVVDGDARLTIIKGSSHDTVAPFAAANPHTW